ncbi:MAG: carbohydrate ABC transporter permease [Chloroflexi bacterium]|nr:carbohydrate ABC transporter permease [Chloroflexota bacterium]
MKESSAMRWTSRVVMIVACLAVIFPLLWVVRIALKTDPGFLADPSGIGGDFMLDNFASAWNAVDLGGAITTSLLITIPGAALATALGVLAGYAFAKLPVPARRLLIALAVGGLTIPIAALVIPEFDQALEVADLFGSSYLDTTWGLTLIYGAFFSSWSALFFFSYFRDLPTDLIEAASLDGASVFQTFRRVALPLAGPAIAVGFVLNVFLQWSEVLLGLIMLPGGKQQTAMTAIASFSTQFRVGGPLTAAAAIIVALPIFALFLVAQRWLKTEIFGGSIKG